MVLSALLLGHPSWGQKTAPAGEVPRIGTPAFRDDSVVVKVRVLDAGGLPLDSPAQVRLFSNVKAVDLTAKTQEKSVANFNGVLPGDYEIEVSSIGFKKTTQHLHVVNRGYDFPVFVYMQSESEPDVSGPAKLAASMKPKLQNEINKGVEFLQNKQYEKATAQFAKATRVAPDNPSVWYLQGTTELGLQRKDAARKDFQQALSLEPNHERALLALAQLQLEAGEISTAIASLEKVYRAHGGGWGTHFLLALAYAQANRLPEAETHAARAAELAARDAAPAMMLLADILCREGKEGEAKQAWERVPARFPGSAAAKEANEKIAMMGNELNRSSASVNESLPLALLPDLAASSHDEAGWAPPDIDSKEYPTASNVACMTDEVLDLAESRLNSQLLNFEKFTATEHVVHQEIDRAGVPGPPKEKQFSYLVFVFPYSGNSLYLDESRDGGFDLSAFPTSLVTTGIMSLGVALLQPVNRDLFVYQCEGLTSVRGQAAWQVRFVEKKSTAASIRRWRTNKGTYNTLVKGRVWIASAGYDMLRVETDLLEPVPELELTRDHLQVNYGPVNFLDGKQWLWLPWSAEMYMEFRHKRYHHQHFLTNYMLFNVDTKEKVSNPKTPPPEPMDQTQ
jgi:Flp pilus assembly protein TadD